MFERSLSAASQSLASKPRLAVELFLEEERARGIGRIFYPGRIAMPDHFVRQDAKGEHPCAASAPGNFQ
jgi:hypothetical protein